jgi:heptosyltransferase-3
MKDRGNSFLKLLDRFVGIPLIFLLSQFKRTRAFPANISSIGILATAAIGDTILISALGQALKVKYPLAKIILFASETNLGVAKLLEGFDEVQFVPVKKPFAAIGTLRKMKVDFLIDTGQWARINALLTFLSGAGYTRGFMTAGQKRHYLYDEVVKHSNQVHELNNFLHLSGPVFAHAPRPLFKESGKEICKQPNLIVCHLKPSGENPWMKEWDQLKWLKLIDELSELGFIIYLTGGAGDRSALDQIFDAVKNKSKTHVVAGEYNLAQTRDLLLSCRLCISVNTGIMHMAAALDTDLIAIHGPTNPLRWGPTSTNAVVIKSSLKCSPCLNLGFDYGCSVNDCMKSIDFSHVFSRVREALGGRSSL